MIYTIAPGDMSFIRNLSGEFMALKGRVVFESKKEATKFITNMTLVSDAYTIYEIDATWNVDTEQSHSIRWHKLNKNCKIIELKEE